MTQPEPPTEECAHQWRILWWHSMNGTVPIDEQCLHCGKYRDEVEVADA